ncbi:MazG-like nucleotide pyrophosphohydrolase family protein [Azorhizobium sp. AG788]|uniref:MazG-like family protein n=1 Tax=Azorhizobium sp. AG788 TaxID=2183897 RepID=UPI00105C51F8|nr:MazG-like family protein [Azorhizobium sp. AG788]TDT94887.1 MazG-like nucleotide pyrophosphohydrolase family protein [Azorhizobium sp. AG788]
MTTFTDLRTALIARQKEWVADSGQEPDVGFRAIEFVGEVGELFNVIKKILREAGGWRGTRATPEDLADEFGDALICLYNLAEKMGVDLDAAAIAKFNRTSEKYGFPHRIMADEPPRCFACREPLQLGQMVIHDITEGLMHATCCGPERDAYVRLDDGSPLEDGEPIPTGHPWYPDTPETRIAYEDGRATTASAGRTGANGED